MTENGPAGYFEIIKQGFKVANHNLAALLTRFLAWVVMAVVIVAFVVVAVVMFFGSLGSLPSLDKLDPGEFLMGLARSSLTLLFVGAIFLVLFIIISTLLSAYVHAGNLGCLVGTARGETRGFTAHGFFESGRRSMVSMLGLFILWVIIILGLFLFFALVGVAVVAGVLMPLKEAGRGLLAFGIGVPFFVVLTLLAIMGVFFYYAGWTFSSVILVAEGAGPFASINRAYRFIKDNFWDVFLFTLLVLALLMGANVVSQVAYAPMGALQDNPAIALVFAPLVLVMAVVQMYLGLIANSCFVVFYVYRTNPELAEHLVAPPPQAPTAPDASESPDAPEASPEPDAVPPQGPGEVEELIDFEVVGPEPEPEPEHRPSQTP